MYTVCPKCALTLLVTAGDLRVAQGYVRCGRCANVFNALSRLSEERPAPGTFPVEADTQVPAERRPPAPTTTAPARPAPATASATPRPTTSAATETRMRPSPAQQAAARLRTPGAVPPAPGKSAAERAPIPAPKAPDPPRTPVPSAPEGIPSGPPAAASTSPESLSPAAPEPEYRDVADAELEFDADSTDVNEVFVVPPPDPAWTAETDSFRASLSAIEAAAHQGGSPQAEAVSSGSDGQAGALPPTPAPGAAPEEAAAGAAVATDGALEFELDADFLSATLAGHSMVAEVSSDLAAAPPDPPAAPEAQSAAPVQTRLGDATASWPTPDSPALPESRAEPPPRPAAPSAAATAMQQEPAPSRTAAHTGTEADLGPFPLEQATTSLHRVPRSATSSAMPGLDAAALGWRYGAAVLGLALVLQVVHHFRNELAADARLGHPVRALYSVMGIPLVPHWDLHAYDVRQLGASVDGAAAGRITVRASIKNAGRHAQPMPMLRVMLEDRFGNRIAARDVAPAAYMPGVHGERYLAAGQRVDAQMSFIDPGANAVGFELDACLPAAGGGIACANDAP